MVINGKCNCFFCQSNKPHPIGHTRWGPTTHRLLKAESLDPKDSVPMKACKTCGHECEA